MAVVSSNVAITTCYADGELFVIEKEPPDTKRKSQNEPGAFEKSECIIKDATKARTINFLL